MLISLLKCRGGSHRISAAWQGRCERLDSIEPWLIGAAIVLFIVYALMDKPPRMPQCDGLGCQPFSSVFFLAPQSQAIHCFLALLLSASTTSVPGSCT